MRKVFLIVLVFLSLLVLALRFGYKPLVKYLGLTPKAGVRVESNQKAKVFFNNNEVGETPYQDENLAEGEYLVGLKKTEATDSAAFSWQGNVKANSGTLSIVSRDLADTEAGSSGEVITLEKGKGVTLVSTPTQSEVVLDGKFAGRTPLSLSTLSSGEHQFIVGKENFLKRNIRATIVDNFNLNLTVDLSLAEADLTKLPTISQTLVSSQLVVKQTPTGFLRVRATPSTDASEIARVNTGDTLNLIEEQPNWDKVKTADGKEGYVSSVYVEKKSQ